MSNKTEKLNIGVTSQNFRTITGHAGKTRRFMIFSAGENGELIESNRLDLPREMSMHEFRGGDHPVDELDVLVTQSCGEGFIRKMHGRGIKVIKTSETDPMTAVKAVLGGSPLPPADPHNH